MRYGDIDRAPLFEEGIRTEVLSLWRRQGMPFESSIHDDFIFDKREEAQPNLDPIPPLKIWPNSMEDIKEFRRRLNPNHRMRLPRNWITQVNKWRNRDFVLILRVHYGFFESVGIGGWKRFMEIMDLLVDDTQTLIRMMRIQGQFNASMVDRVLKDVEIDAAIFSEPIAGIHGPLISPKTYRQVALKSYQPLMEVLKRNGVMTIILRSYANIRILLPDIINSGFNCLWACECETEDMDYRKLRRDFGTELRLIGGIDTDALRRGKESIRKEVTEKVPQLLEQGGYAPLVDGRVREGVTYENYLYYRNLLEQVVLG
jgi:hypothetical protein